MIISVDDGCASDVRVAELCDQYRIETTFYLPVEWQSLAYYKGYRPLSYDQALSLGEIGSHTITHRFLTDLNESDAWEEIVFSQSMLKKLFRRPIKKFAPPRGYTNDKLTKLTLDFYDSQRLTKGKGLVHIHPNSGANNNKPWRDCIDENTKELWCHSWELDKYDLWGELEDFLGKL